MRSGRHCIVIGAGLLGLATAWSLSRRGWSVEVLEAGAEFGHPFSGSKGDVRIFRIGYPEPHYVAMALAARKLWRELEDATSRTLMFETGQLSFGDRDALDAIEAALASHEEASVRLTRDEARVRFPNVSLPGSALFEPASGVLVADECLRALHAAGGFDLRARTRVIRVESDGGGVTVRGEDEESWRADVVVDCAGPGALALLGDAALSVGAPPSLPQVAYFGPRSGGPPESDPTRLPVFIEWGDAMVYGLPVVDRGTHAGTYKVSHHTPGPPLSSYDPTDAAAAELETDDPPLLAALSDAVGRLFPGLDPTPVATERCVYDNSADTDFVLDRIGNVVVGCGTSGHGFKFGPLLGELLADLAEGSKPSIDLAPFRFDRLDRLHRFESGDHARTTGR